MSQAEEVKILSKEARELKAACASLNSPNDFKVGDLITWKEGMRNRKFPVDGDPCVVTAVLPEIVFGGDEETGSMYYREPFNIKIGTFDRDGDFIEHHVDGRRFTHYTE